MKKSYTITEYLANHLEWEVELIHLLSILRGYDFEESIKWNAPVYSFGKQNIVGIGAFKNYVGLWFYQGVFLKDEKNLLMNAQEGTTKALRQWRFNGLDDILKYEEEILLYINEAIQNHKEGKVMKPQKVTKPLIIPIELNKALNKDVLLKDKFNSLSPSCKREYAEYISEAKKEATKIRRIQKITPFILAAKGLNDKYKK